jgi:hypothetical protein
MDSKVRDYGPQSETPHSAPKPAGPRPDTAAPSPRADSSPGSHRPAWHLASSAAPSSGPGRLPEPPAFPPPWTPCPRFAGVPEPPWPSPAARPSEPDAPDRMTGERAEPGLRHMDGQPPHGQSKARGRGAGKRSRPGRYPRQAAGGMN